MQRREIEHQRKNVASWAGGMFRVGRDSEEGRQILCVFLLTWSGEAVDLSNLTEL